MFWVRKMSLNFEIFGQRRSSSSKQSGHLVSADWKNRCLFKTHCSSFPEEDCLRVARMQVGFPCELANHMDCVLTRNQADFQESSLVSFSVHLSSFWEKFVHYADNLGTHIYLAMSARPLFLPILHLPCSPIMNSPSLGIHKCLLPYRLFDVQ